MLKKNVYILALIIVTLSACGSESAEDTTADSTAIRQSDSMVNRDKERSDSMMNALKEKLK